jgi:hypothetical protein
MTLDISSLPPASNSSMVTFGFSDSRLATIELEEPEPQMMKS